MERRGVEEGGGEVERGGVEEKGGKGRSGGGRWRGGEGRSHTLVMCDGTCMYIRGHKPDGRGHTCDSRYIRGQVH